MFRLYNSSFKRLLDPDGMSDWIRNFNSDKNDERAVTSSFEASSEFKERFGDNISILTYVNTLYKKVPARDGD